MVKELIHDPIMLKIKSKDADIQDIQTAKDLAETLEYHRNGCVGMAANMIGVFKRIIVFYDDKKNRLNFYGRKNHFTSCYRETSAILKILGRT